LIVAPHSSFDKLRMRPLGAPGTTVACTNSIQAAFASRHGFKLRVPHRRSSLAEQRKFLHGSRRPPVSGRLPEDVGITPGVWRESIDGSRELLADVAESIVRWISATLEPRQPRHCWSASVCRLDSPPNLAVETPGC
jgi:hypothetical protein